MPPPFIPCHVDCRNHFQQSYTLQVQWILEAVFSRLGVRHQARNFGNGGLGTLHNAIAAGSIYGPDVDFLMWDSSMTEKEKKAVDVFARQALMGGSKVPVLWSLFPDVMAPLHDHADVDVGVAGTGLSGITLQSTFEETEAVPWAAQYVLCTGDVTKYCRENEYIGRYIPKRIPRLVPIVSDFAYFSAGTCWIEREDVTPPTKQGTPGGRASWHPGNRKHQVTGRVLAFTLLTALKEVLTDWNDADGHEIADEDWHVTQYYNNIRTKLSSLEGGACMEYSENDLDFVCKYPMKVSSRRLYFRSLACRLPNSFVIDIHAKGSDRIHPQGLPWPYKYSHPAPYRASRIDKCTGTKSLLSTRRFQPGFASTSRRDRRSEHSGERSGIHTRLPSRLHFVL